jgi:cbb3-type cytochrome oxidase subunit 3
VKSFQGFAEEHALMVLVLLELAVIVFFGRRGVGGRSES